MRTEKSLSYKTILSFIILLMTGMGTSMAETRYVNDYLRVGLRPSPDNDSTPLAVVKTGEKLEILDKDSGYVLARTPEGVEGWIKEVYTTTEQPAIVRLNALSKSTGGSSQKILELQKQLNLMQSANKVLNTELEETKSEKSKIQMQLLASRGGEPSGLWLYWLVALLVFTIASFISGMYWYRSQAMKRLGGLRIYF